MRQDLPTTISTFEERWWHNMLASRRLAHQLEPDESGECSYPECVWHGVLPGEDNAVSPASPP